MTLPEDMATVLRAEPAIMWTFIGLSALAVLAGIVAFLLWLSERKWREHSRGIEAELRGLVEANDAQFAVWKAKRDDLYTRSINALELLRAEIFTLRHRLWSAGKLSKEEASAHAKMLRARQL